MFDSHCTGILSSIATHRLTLGSMSPLVCSEAHADRRKESDKLHISWDLLCECLLTNQQAVKAAKSECFSSFVAANIHKLQVVFNVLDSLVNPCDTVFVEPSSSLVRDFLKFFINKVSALKQ